MIVRNEAHVIRRCLQSARPFIDAWVIVDTGSTDGTQQIVRDELKGLPGQLYERPWRNFAENRNEAINLAKGSGDFLLFIDADDVFESTAGFMLPDLAVDAYDLSIEYGGSRYSRTCLVRNTLPWHYVGVLHEYLDCNCSFDRKRLDGLWIKIIGGGARSQTAAKEKYTRDADTLEKALKLEPDNTRYAFYLAQSYRDSGQFEKAHAAYRHRVSMGGFEEEIFCSLLEIARLHKWLGHGAPVISAAFLQAHDYRPTRAEPLGELARLCREDGQRWPSAYLFASRAIQISMPADVLFVGREWYEWCCLDEFAIAAYWIGEYEKSRRACMQLLDSALLPASERARVTENLRFATLKLDQR